MLPTSSVPIHGCRHPNRSQDGKISIFDFVEQCVLIGMFVSVDDVVCFDLRRSGQKMDIGQSLGQSIE